MLSLSYLDIVTHYSLYFSVLNLATNSISVSTPFSYPFPSSPYISLPKTHSKFSFCVLSILFISPWLGNLWITCSSSSRLWSLTPDPRRCFLCPGRHHHISHYTWSYEAQVRQTSPHTCTRYELATDLCPTTVNPCPIPGQRPTGK